MSKKEERIASLIQAFQEQKDLSVQDMMTLLSCNRQSVYNRLNDLKERGFDLHQETRDGKTYYSLAANDQESAASTYYLPLDDRKLLRKYSLIQQLYKHPCTAKNLVNRFLVFSSGQKVDFSINKIPTDVSYTSINDLISELESEGEIKKDSRGIYHPTGRSIPIMHHFTADDLFSLLDQLKILPSGSPYHTQLQSITRKMSILENSYSLETKSDSNYLIYGRKHEILKQIGQWIKKISSTNFTEKLIQIQYTARSGQTLDILFQTGLLIYSVEKGKLYLLGKECSCDPVPVPDRAAIIDVSTIIKTQNSDHKNDSYQSPVYQQIFAEMFSISLEKPVEVVVRFDLEANVQKKIEQLTSQRSKAFMTILPDEKQAEYTDTIRGIDDFANYLRQFGRSVHVIAPDSLKQKMDFSIERTLKRYEENDHE